MRRFFSLLAVIALLLGFAACSKSETASNNNGVAASTQLSWDRGNWDQQSWQ